MLLLGMGRLVGGLVNCLLMRLEVRLRVRIAWVKISISMLDSGMDGRERKGMDVV